VLAEKVEDEEAVEFRTIEALRLEAGGTRPRSLRLGTTLAAEVGIHFFTSIR
jgi:hypothetical protein